ncbi:MAG: PEP/pyruvate-binding domain-containing protein [Gammaproteobacteria bacterium]
MKVSPKGPFARIRWFCNDGAVLPPEPFACRDHGGGIQHGEWNQHTRVLRQQGYLLGNVLAAVDAQSLAASPSGREALKQILLERFLMLADDGWIFRGARHYRGALQAEDEAVGARHILEALLRERRPLKQRFLLLRQAAALLPHGQPNPLVTEVRQLSTTLAEADPGFAPLRNKLHTQPAPEDAARVRDYATGRAQDPLAPAYARLADAIDRLYATRGVVEQLRAVTAGLPDNPLRARLRQGAEVLANHLDPDTRFHETGELLAYLRHHLRDTPAVAQQLVLLDASIALEREAFAAGTSLLGRLAHASRRHRLYWLADAADALYGTGLLTERQYRAVTAALQDLDRPALSARQYRRRLRYLARIPEWANRWERFHFSRVVDHWRNIEPRAADFIPDQLRGGPLLVYSALLDGLLRDANRLAGIDNRLFGQPVGLGLRALNPGLARGVLQVQPVGAGTASLRSDGIYLLPATTPALPRVAGILTLGEGNALSHVQILAANLGIPNVAVEPALTPRLTRHAGERVVLAVSPGGRVQLVADGPRWNRLFEASGTATDEITVDMNKLDLRERRILSLRWLRATDAGRIVGPKAANLGELKHRFPHYVTDGVVIPFGVFRALLNQPLESGGPSVHEWMRQEYRRIGAIADRDRRRRAIHAFLARLRHWIRHADPGAGFRRDLRAAMDHTFGPDGSYGVFVRSDTNVEDLPGFTGAGLNLTMPNVRGFDQVLTAIARVWASPFTDRAYAWRQARMAHPERVYVSVLLMRSVPAEQSGVMVTRDLETGSRNWYTVAANEGIGGAVSGQAAEELRISAASGTTQLLAEATTPVRRQLNPAGGLQTVPVSGAGKVLSRGEISQLLDLARQLPTRFPLRDEHGRPQAADIEFGFVGGRLALFQIRPYVRNRDARRNGFLVAMDRQAARTADRVVDLDQVPPE